MHRDPIPTLAAWISAVLCLVAPVALADAAPDVVAWGGGLVLYLAVVPAFVLPYLYEWRGAAAALVLGEASLLGSAFLMVQGGVSPEGLGPVNVALLLIAAGAGRVTTLLHRSRIEAEERALSDPGTGLPNRRYALVHLKRGFAAAARGAKLTVVAFDLDNFKQVNDRHGHAAGDHVLATFARILKERTRDMNLSARLGGEEFISILEGAGLEGAVTFAEEVRMAMEVTHFPFGTVTVSAGVASYEKGMASPDVLRAAADQALYHAKSRGRNQVAVVGAVPALGKYHPVELDAPSRPAGQGERILFVEEEREARTKLGAALRRSGFDVVEAPSPEAAIRLVRGPGTPPALVVTDLILSSMTGLGLMEELRKIRPSLRVLYLTRGLSDGHELGGAPGEIRGFLRRPVSLTDLVRAIREVLDATDPPAAETGEAARAPGSNHRVQVMAAGRLREDDLCGRLLRLGFDRVEVVRDGARAHVSDPPDVLVVWPGEPEERLLADVEPYLTRWPSEARPALLLVAEKLPAPVAERWPGLFPALMIGPRAPLQELEIGIRHLLEVRALSDRYLKGHRGMAAQVAARTAELEKQSRDVLVRLARIAELKDDLTGGHVERVGQLSARLGAAIGLPAPTVELLLQAAPLHDLGKIATPDAILNKPDVLTHLERDLMRQHTVIGAQLLSGSPHRVLQEAERIACSHHERWDGEGYPHGLKGEEIPIMARIVAVADAYDRMIHQQSYRDALSPERAVQIITEDAGSHFDPVIAKALAQLAREGELDSESAGLRVRQPELIA